MKRVGSMKKEDFVILGIMPHVIANKQGKKIGVFFEIQDYERLVSEIEDVMLGAIASVIKRKKGSTVSLEEIEKKIKRKHASKIKK